MRTSEYENPKVTCCILWCRTVINGKCVQHNNNYRASAPTTNNIENERKRENPIAKKKNRQINNEFVHILLTERTCRDVYGCASMCIHGRNRNVWSNTGLCWRKQNINFRIITFDNIQLLLKLLKYMLLLFFFSYLQLFWVCATALIFQSLVCVFIAAWNLIGFSFDNVFIFVVVASYI